MSMADTASLSSNTTTKYDEYDIPSSDIPESTWNPEDMNNLLFPRGTGAYIHTPQTTSEPVRILIVGLAGSGKTYVIEDSHRGAKEPIASGPYEATKHVKVTRLRYKEQLFELVDTPGFDNLHISDADVFSEIAGHLLNPKRIQKGITGIIYVHRAGNTVLSGSLLRNFRVLTNIFLGQAVLARLTFLVTQTGCQDLDCANLLGARDSVFKVAFSAGARFAPNPNRLGLIQLLEFYASKKPVMLSIQLNYSHQSQVDLVTQIEKELGYYKRNSAQSLRDNQEQQLRELYEKKHASQRRSEEKLRQQLQQLQLDYFSLQAQVQLQTDTDPSLNQVIQTLDSLNHMITAIGSSLSAHITSDYVLAAFGKDPSNVTALDALDLPSLKASLGHIDGRSSLIASSDGRGMQIGRFFDYSIRNLLCRYLVKSVFEPFHPKISPSLSQSLLTTYGKLQKQDPQTSAGKWRSDTFASICGPDGPDASKHDIDPHFNKLISEHLKPLLKHVLGFDVALEEEHCALIRCAVTMAWDWNSRLKGCYIEDFVLTAFRHPCRLNSELMEEFESRSGSQEPTNILCTLALGLLSRTAIGGGNTVEQKSICRALVVTRNIYR